MFVLKIMKLFGIDFFPQSIREAEVIRAIQNAEAGTSGEIRVHISNAWLEKDLIKSAQKQFVALKMDQTQERNGVLLYFNLPKHKFAIYGDEGIHSKVTQNFWNDLAKEITDVIHHDDLTTALVMAVSKIGAALKLNFPAQNGSNPNELKDEISKS